MIPNKIMLNTNILVQFNNIIYIILSTYIEILYDQRKYLYIKRNIFKFAITKI